MSIVDVSAKAAPLKPATVAGGTCQMNADAPESSAGGAVKFQNAVLPRPMPLSYGQLA